jgi:hypothetical protein
VTRLGRIQSGRRFDLPGAFRFLGAGPSRRELGLVVDLLRESKVEVSYDEDLVRLAEENGSSAFVALDVAAAVAHGVESLSAGPPWTRSRA